VGLAPDWFCHVLLELNSVLFALLLIRVLLAGLAGVGPAESFVVTNMRWVATLEWTKNRRFNRLPPLFGESFARSISDDIVMEAAVLSDILFEGLVTVEDLGVQTGILFAVQILFAFKWVLAVADVLELSEGLGSLAVIEARNWVGRRLRSFLLHVDKFALAHGAVTMHREEGLGLRGGG